MPCDDGHLFTGQHSLFLLLICPLSEHVLLIPREADGTYVERPKKIVKREEMRKNSPLAWGKLAAG